MHDAGSQDLKLRGGERGPRAELEAARREIEQLKTERNSLQVQHVSLLPCAAAFHATGYVHQPGFQVSVCHVPCAATGSHAHAHLHSMTFTASLFSPAFWALFTMCSLSCMYRPA